MIKGQGSGGVPAGNSLKEVKQSKEVATVKRRQEAMIFYLMYDEGLRD